MASRTALYIRSSKDRHDVSVESQRNELRKFADANDIIVVAEFVDKVESAKTANRPAFQDMMAEVKAADCRFTDILCYDTSRFSRRQYDAQVYKHLLKKKGIGLRFLKLPKSEPLMDSVLESLMEVFDEFHSQKSKSDGLRGMRENINQGYRAGGAAPHGYRLEKHVVSMRDGMPITKSTLTPDPIEAPKVKAFLEARAAGESRKATAERVGLNKSASVLLYMENNALTYAGHSVWNRHNERVEGGYIGGNKFRDQSEWVIKRDTHEAIILEETANTILAMCAGRSRRSTRHRVNNYLLSGILKCRCGATMHGNSGYYRCSARCGSRGIKQDTLDGIVIQTLLNDLLTEDAISQIVELAEEHLKHETSSESYGLQELKAEITSLDKEIPKLIELLTKVEHQRSLLKKLDELEAQRAELESNIEEANQTKPDQLLDNYADITEFLREFRAGLTDENCEKRKLVVKSLVGEAELDGNELTLFPAEALTGFNVASPRRYERLTPLELSVKAGALAA